MVEQIAIVHRRGGKNTSPSLQVPEGTACVHWDTCLRQILFVSVDELSSFEDSLLPTDEIHLGLEAMKFCLEITCGLQSPIIGETEVLGQFREKFLALDLPPSQFALALQLFVNQVLRETKRIRQKHLTGQGSQSYGSTVRKLCKNQPEIRILGAGQLAREILPWIYGKSLVSIACRSPEKAADLLKASPALQLQAISGPACPGTGALIVAAPMSSREIAAWLSRSAFSPRLIIDLRADSEKDPLSEIVGSSCLVYTLQLFFEEAARRQEELLCRKNAALDEIQEICEEFQRRVEVRPSGWDDLCA